MKYCIRCFYILNHLPEDRCPECGQVFDPEDPETFRTSVPVKVRRRIAWVLGVYSGVLLLNFAFWGFISRAHGADWLAGAELSLWSVCGPLAWLLKPSQTSFLGVPWLNVLGFAIWTCWLICVCTAAKLRNAPCSLHFLTGTLWCISGCPPVGLAVT